MLLYIHEPSILLINKSHHLTCYFAPGTVLSTCVGLLDIIITPCLLPNYYTFTGEKLEASLLGTFPKDPQPVSDQVENHTYYAILPHSY